jgi:hypothetical protein
MIRRLIAPMAAALALAMVPQAALAADKPDLSGFWELTRGKPVRDAALEAKIAPDTVVLDDTGGPELAIGDFGGLKPTPAALAAAKAWKPEDEMTVSKACAAPSIVYAMQGPFPMEVYQGTEFIIFKLEYYDLIRIIFMNGQHPPAEAAHSKLGHSIGRWEGDTLVVDTTHLEAATITNNGLGHSDKVRVIERYKLAADGTLVSTQEFEDPENLQNRGARWISWRKRPGERVLPYDCDPAFSANYQTK